MSNESSDIEKQDIADLTARVNFALPFCLYLEDGTYEVFRGTWTALVHVERVKQDHRPSYRLGFRRRSVLEWSVFR